MGDRCRWGFRAALAAILTVALSAFGDARPAAEFPRWEVGAVGTVSASDGTRGTFTLTRHLPGAEGRSVFLASGTHGARVVIVRSAAGVTVVRREQDGRRTGVIRTKADGETRSRTLDPSDYRGHCMTPSTLPKLPTGLFLYAADPVVAESPETDGSDTLIHIVDVLVAYDAPAAQWLTDNGWDAGTFAETQVAKMNAALENSGIDLREDFHFRLVGTRTLTAESLKSRGSDNETRFLYALDKLDTYSQQELVAGDGLRGLVEARHSTGADVAVLFAHTGTKEGTIGASWGFMSYGGEAWDSPKNLAYCGRRAFSVCEIAPSEADVVAIHEVGHLMGAGHPGRDQVNPQVIVCGPQLFDYSSAYLFHTPDSTSKWYYTIMGYSFDGWGPYGFTSVESFSTPDRTYHRDGVDTGVPLGVAGKCDNVRTLLNSYARVAQFRRHVREDDIWTEADVRVTATEGGSAIGGGIYFEGETVSLKATCERNHVFAGWHEINAAGATNRLESSGDYRDLTCTIRVGKEDRSIVAVFVRKNKTDDPVTEVQALFDPSGFRAGVACDIAPAADAVSASRPSFSATGLPPGLKFDTKANRLYGTPTKPGPFTLTLIAKNQSGATLREPVAVTVANWRDGTIPVAEGYGPFVPGVPVTLDLSAEAAGCTASGLPTGMKWTKTKGLLAGTPTKPGTWTVTFTKSVKDEVTRKSVTHKASSTFAVGPYPVLTIEPFGEGTGKLTGGGAYAANKKVTLKATADTKNAAATARAAAKVKSAFAGWYDAAGNRLSQAASFAYVMPPEDTTVRGRFVTAEADAASIALAVDGVRLAAGGETAWTNFCGVALDWPVEADALSLPATAVSSLPAGLKYDKKAGRITGAPTAVSKKNAKTGAVTPSAVKFTVTTAGKNKLVHTLRLYVAERPAWSVGTFDGAAVFGGDPGTSTFTVKSTGAVSGKYVVNGKSRTATAKSIAAWDEGTGRFRIDAITKLSSKFAETNALYLSAAESATETLALGDLLGEGDGFLTDAGRNVWSDKGTGLPVFPTASAAKIRIDLAAVPDIALPEGASLVLTFGAKGALTYAGKYGRLSLSGSAKLAVRGVEEVSGKILSAATLALPARDAYGFSGWCRTIGVRISADENGVAVVEEIVCLGEPGQN